MASGTIHDRAAGTVLGLAKREGKAITTRMETIKASGKEN
jgi:hypothetical protein